jgi:hypothetical protein
LKTQEKGDQSRSATAWRRIGAALVEVGVERRGSNAAAAYAALSMAILTARKTGTAIDVEIRINAKGNVSECSLRKASTGELISSKVYRTSKI